MGNIWLGEWVWSTGFHFKDHPSKSKSKLSENLSICSDKSTEQPSQQIFLACQRLGLPFGRVRKVFHVFHQFVTNQTFGWVRKKKPKLSIFLVTTQTDQSSCPCLESGGDVRQAWGDVCRSLWRERNCRQVNNWSYFDLLRIFRFRANLIVEGGEAFGEESWSGFQIGGAEFKVGGPCRRYFYLYKGPCCNVHEC